MIHMQVIGKEGSKLQPLIRAAIQDGKIKAFQVVQVSGGLKIQHAKHPGSIKFSQKRHILFVTLTCKNKNREWQILESFIGRLSYHFKDNITAINLQLE